MSRILEGKIALVTGASRGIGRAIALRLGRDGALVAVHYAREREAAAGTVKEIESAGGSAFPIGVELGRWPGPDSSVEDTTEEVFDGLFALNVKVPFFIAQKALPRMREGGRIINVSSGVTRIAFPNKAAYSMTKGALNVMTLALASQLGPRPWQNRPARRYRRCRGIPRVAGREMGHGTRPVRSI
jgi:3-oxoacyl-[acyl-carrier protein] reductase